MCLRAPHPPQTAIGRWLQALQSPTCCASVPLLLSQFQQASPGWGKPCVLPSTRSSLGPAPFWRYSVPRARGASPISPAPQEAGAWCWGARPALSALLSPGCQRGASARGSGQQRCRELPGCGVPVGRRGQRAAPGRRPRPRRSPAGPGPRCRQRLGVRGARPRAPPPLAGPLSRRRGCTTRCGGGWPSRSPAAASPPI